jgi:hypothetical protein
MPYSNENEKSISESPLIFNATIKENIFLLIVFGWSGWALILPNLLGILRSKNNSWLWIFITLSSIILCMIIGYENVYSKSIITLAIVVLLVAIDCYNKRFIQNTLIHLVNTSYIGIALTFLIMESYPDSYPSLWLTILPSANRAFDMVILCLIFQNLGYYLIGSWLIPQNGAISRWAASSKNIANLSFVKTNQDQLKLFVFMSLFGLISRFWNLSLGKIYYTEGSGVPFYISSFLAQFDRLYVVAWLYGCSFWLQRNNRENKAINLLTLGLTIVESIYQILSGSKGRFFNFIVIPMASTFLLTRQRVSSFVVVTLSVTSFFSWLFVYPILVIYRGILDANPLGNIIDPFATFNKSYQIFISLSSEKYIEQILIPLNASGVAEAVMAMTSIIHYNVSQDSGLIWLRLFFFWVPRFLWEDKPANLSANMIGRLSHRVGEDNFGTSVLITSPGELYLYYGLLGSSLMVLLGFIIFFMNQAISPFKLYSSFRIAIFISYIPILRDFLIGNFEAGLTGLILQLGVMYGMISFARKLV